LVLGASGFIGSAVCARLVADGHRVLGVSRNRYDAGLVSIEHIALDISRATAPQDWLPLLPGVEAVVNCAGTLQDSPGESTYGVHAAGIAALVAACARAKVSRIIHLSAIGVDQNRPSRFSRSKRQGDDALMRSDLDWVILRPSVVLGRAAYGGSALLRGLAALPLEPRIPDAAPVQLVHLDDLVDTIMFFLQPNAPARVVLELAGPRPWAFDDTVRLLGSWLRNRPAATVVVSGWMAAAAYRIGDAVSLLGWRPPIRTTARLEISRGAVGDPSQWERVTGIVPRDIEQALIREPASVQERWFSRLYFLKPAVIGVFALFWIATGAISFGPGWSEGTALLRDADIGASLAALIVVASALADIAVGFLILYRPTCRFGLSAALALSIAYVIVGTVLAPRLWADPLGPLLKVAPIVILNLVALAILDDR
jgi:uncharacterized protein YbjT (DUF2867 family)